MIDLRAFQSGTELRRQALLAVLTATWGLPNETDSSATHRATLESISAMCMPSPVPRATSQ